MPRSSACVHYALFFIFPWANIKKLRLPWTMLLYDGANVGRLWCEIRVMNRHKKKHNVCICFQRQLA